MSAKPRILVDTNIVLDVLAKREPHYTASAAIWAMVEHGKLEGVLAAHTVTTLHYLISKHLTHSQTNLTLTKLLQVFGIAAVDQQVILNALALGWSDFEDAVQMAAALNAGVDYLVTRNPKDFKESPVKVLQPGDLMALFPASGQ